MDETFETSAPEEEGGAAPTDAIEPADAIGKEHTLDPTTTRTAVGGGNLPPQTVPAPMPLSMPPFSSPTPPSGGFGGGGVPPMAPPPYGYGWYEFAPPPPPSRHQGWFVVVAVIVALLVGGLGAGLGATYGGGSNTGSVSIASLPHSAGSNTVQGTSSAESAIYNSVKSSIVDINTNVASAVGESEQAAGTGMIITSSGEVLTNNHVIKDATTIEVQIPGRSGPDNGQYPAKVLGVDPTQDVALLQVAGVSGLPVISLGNSSSVTVGEQVYSIGNAGGLGGSPSIVSGTVTALDRQITASDEDGANPETLSGLIQTDAPIQSGDSGGPMVDSNGQVVGMDTAASMTDGEETIGFAIPIDHATTIAYEIASGTRASGITIGYSPFLGVELAQASSSSGGLGGNGFFGFGNTGTPSAPPSVAGVPIEGVVANSPAESAGLVGGDTITAIGSTPVTTEAGLTAAIAQYKPGQSASVTFVDTSGNSHTVRVTFTAIPE